jgi:hypothetical protein
MTFHIINPAKVLLYNVRGEANTGRSMKTYIVPLRQVILFRKILSFGRLRREVWYTFTHVLISGDIYETHFISGDIYETHFISGDI